MEHRRAHRSRCHAEDVGDLGLGVALHVEQHERGSVPLGELGQRRAQALAEEVALGLRIRKWGSPVTVSSSTPATRTVRRLRRSIAALATIRSSHGPNGRVGS